MGLQKVIREKNEVVSLNIGCTCNQCGKREELKYPSKYGFPNMHTFSAAGGFDTSFPGDTEEVSFALCSDCLKALVQSFRVPPEHKYTMHCSPIDVLHTEAEEILVYEAGWVKTKKAPDPYRTTDYDEYNRLVEVGLEGFERPEDRAVFEHFKGGRYQVIDGAALHADTKEVYVVYRALYGTSMCFARPLKMWSEEVEKLNYKGPRFKFLYMASL